MSYNRQITGQNQYVEKLLKLVPTEIVAAFVSIQGILLTQPSTVLQPWLFGIALFLAFVVLPLYLRKAQDVQSPAQILLTTLAFLIWAYNMGGNNMAFLADDFNPAIASVLLILFTVIAPLYKGQP